MNTTKQFDVSDVDPPFFNDKLDDVLAIAAEVLAEYGEDPAAMKTRLGRLAQWLILNVGGEPHQTDNAADGFDRYIAHPKAYPLVRIGGVFAVERSSEDIAAASAFLKTSRPAGIAIATNEEAARAFAVALLRATERDD